MEKSCVYKIAFKSSDLFYIGSTKLYKSRVRNHLCQLRKNRHHNPNLQKLVNDLGIDDLFFSVIEYVSISEVEEKEQYYLDLLKPPLNISLNRRNVGRKYTAEQIKRVSDGHIGIKPTLENIEKRRATMKAKFENMSQEEKKRRIQIALENRPKRRVLCIETNKEYESIAIAERETGCDNIGLICKGQRNYSKGLTFKYLN